MKVVVLHGYSQKWMQILQLFIDDNALYLQLLGFHDDVELEKIE